MKRLFGFLTAAAFVAAFGASAYATSPGSGSIEVSPVSNGLISVFQVTSAGATTKGTAAAGMTADIAVSSGSGTAVLVTGSLESFISTDTTVSGNGGKTSSQSTAEAAVVVTPTLTSPTCDKIAPGNVAACADTICDATETSPPTTLPTGVSFNGTPINFFNIQPAPVTYNERLQQLTALLGQVCTESNSTVTCTGEETVELLLSTMTANSFQFAATGLSSGAYEVTLCIGAEATAGTNATLGSGATAMVGVGPGVLSATIVKAETPVDCLDLTGSGGGGCTSFSF